MTDPAAAVHPQHIPITLQQASGSIWIPIATVAAALVGAFAGQALAHYWASRRDRKNKAREAYSKFGAALDRHLVLANLMVEWSRALSRFDERLPEEFNDVEPGTPAYKQRIEAAELARERVRSKVDEAQDTWINSRHDYYGLYFELLAYTDKRYHERIDLFYSKINSVRLYEIGQDGKATDYVQRNEELRGEVRSWVKSSFDLI